MRMTIRVGNLDLSTSETDLRQLCSPYGEIRKVRLVANIRQESGVIGIVEMQSEEECRSAMAALGGLDYRGRALTVCRGRSRNPAQPHPGTSCPVVTRA